MKHSLCLLIALCIATAFGCASSDGPIAPETPQVPQDGPFVEITTDKATVSPGETVTVSIRTGMRDDGVVTYVENVEIYASASDTEEGSIEGFTDAEGRLAQTLTFDDDDENGIFIELRAEYPSGEVPEREHWIYRPNELKVDDQRTTSQAAVLFRRDGGATVGFRDYVFSDVEDVGMFSADHSTTRSGSIGAMSSTASATTAGALGVKASPALMEFVYDFTASGDVSLTDPITNGSYFAQSGTDAGLDVEFYVWGAKNATMTITGNIDMALYEIEFVGSPFDEDNEEDVDELICYRDGSGVSPGCAQINRTLILEPGRYEIYIESEDYRNFKDEGPTEGRAEYSGSADITVTLTQ